MNESTAAKTIEQAHKEALKMHAVERYIANEMTEEQSLRFEEHYFECAECAEAVRAGQEFIAGIEPLPSPRRAAFIPSWIIPSRIIPSWISPAFAALMLAVVGYQNTATIPALRAQLAPQANTDILANEVEMGSEAGPVPVPTQSITVRFDQPETKYSFYRASFIRNRQRLLSLLIPSPPAGNPFSVHLTKETLGSGSFTIALVGLASQDASDGKPLPEHYFKLD